ncbi:MAG: hypothetical protein AD742_14780 [Methylibium sp. NZG]|nr:MAG: hypothetical protein AD742_14780 [Methylibium sp. NZG]
MALDLAMLLSALESLLGVAQRERHHKEAIAETHDTKKKEALQAIYIAIAETRKYQEMNITAPVREKEYELAKLWTTASIQAQRFFGELSQLGADKAEYWTSQLKLPDDLLASKGIDLVSVEAKFKALLGQPGATLELRPTGQGKR